MAIAAVVAALVAGTVSVVVAVFIVGISGLTSTPPSPPPSPPQPQPSDGTDAGAPAPADSPADSPDDSPDDGSAPTGGKPDDKSPPSPEPEPPAASRHDEMIALRSGVTSRAAIREPDGSVWFRLAVPDDAIALDLHATCEDGPLNLSVYFGHGDDGADEWTSDASRDQHLHVAEHASHAFRTGIIYVEAALDGEASAESPARLKLDASVIRAAAAAGPPGETFGAGEIAGTTQPATGFRRTYRVKMPDGARVARFDVVETDRDLDLFVDAGAASVRTENAAFRAEGQLCLETLVAFADGTAIPADRIVSLTVTDPTCYEEPVAFRIRVSFSEEVPEDLRKVDPLPSPSAPKDRALLASVELVLDDGTSGSGTIVRDDGLILTAAHVVDCVDALDRMPTKLDDEDGPAPVVVSLSLDPRTAPRDLFRGHLVYSDPARDVALVKITQGLRGQPLPKGYVFPAAPVGRSMTVGVADEIIAVGYPGVGGIGSRNPVTASRGTFSGFDRGVHGLQGKTDALVSPGSSGGAVFDTSWTLTGVLVSTMDDGGGNALGYFVPIDEVPEAWRRLVTTTTRK